MKTLILPEVIDLWRNTLCACAEAAEFGDMLICDLKSRQCLRKRFAIVLRICPRAWNSAHVDDDADLRSSEQVDKFADRARGMTDGEASSWPLCFRIRVGPSAEAPQHPSLVQRYVVGLVALDLVLRLIRRSAMNVAFIIDGPLMHFDDFPRTRPASEFQLT